MHLLSRFYRYDRYDHLLFLAGLLLVCPTVRAAVRLITCFTIAHSITLALSTFQIVSLSSHVVEPLIAASIVYVGVEISCPAAFSAGAKV